MTLKRFMLAVIVAVLAIVGINLVIHRLATNAPARVLLRAIDQPKNIDVLLLGNSLMAAGGDTASFASAWPSNQPAVECFNAALGWSSPVEHLIIANRAVAAHPNLRCVVYGFFDFQLTDPPRTSFADLSGNRAMALYADADLAADMYVPGSPLAKWQYRAAGAVPMITDRGNVWQKVEIIRRRLAGIGMPPEQHNEFGRVGDFRALEASSGAAFERACFEAIRSNATFAPPIEKLIARAAAVQARLVFVEMPMPPEHRRQFYSTAAWEMYRARLRQLADERSALYVNASDWFPVAKSFADELHMSRESAVIFSACLAGEVSRAMTVRPSR